MAFRSIAEMTCQAGALNDQSADVVIIPVLEDQSELSPELAKLFGGATGPVGVLISSDEFTGGMAKTAVAYGASDAFPRAILVGMGTADALTNERLRQVAAAGAREARARRCGTALMVLPFPGCDVGLFDQVEVAGEGALLGTYEFDAPKSYPDGQPHTIDRMTFLLPSGTDDSDADAALRRGMIRAAGTSVARDLGHTPANLMNPTHLAERAAQLAKESDLKLTVIEREEAEALGMGAYLGVARGSEEPPKFILLEYDCGDANAPTVGIIGKGITFDTGGISLKPAPKMDEMKYDMCGSAAVLGAMSTLRGLDVKVNVVMAVPATENMPGGRATKPGDVHTSLSGKTIEVLNTDAEGRLVLADALTYVARTFEPDAMIDMATLTGAVIVALGHYGAAVVSNSDELCERIASASESSGERSWRLPIWEEYPEHLKSAFADLKNIADGNAGAGTIAGGAFLQEFVDDIPWAHIDIAGTAWWDRDRPHIPKGASGYGVRLLIDLIESYAK